MKKMKWTQAQQTATPFIESLGDLGVFPHSPQFCELRDDLAELLQEVHKMGFIDSEEHNDE